MQLKTYIKSLRIFKGFTQEKLAAAIGVSRPTLDNWEKGTICPRVDELENLLHFLGFSLEDYAKAKKIKCEEP